MDKQHEIYYGASDNAVTELEKVMQVMLPPEYAIYVDKEQGGALYHHSGRSFND